MKEVNEEGKLALSKEWPRCTMFLHIHDLITPMSGFIKYPKCLGGRHLGANKE